MTTRIAPDYHLELILTPMEFQSIRGNAFCVDVVFEGSVPISGELLIPEFNDFPELSKRVKAWLWLNEPVELEPGGEIKTILREPSEYAITEQQYNDLLAHQGLTIKGFVSIDT
ncbi:MAG: hypothetical protein RB296_09100 [Acidobacteriota bacterium]|jgi:hypothetical protein|nr:hypothetical protein [Acidobacteriota bacterium]